MKAELQFITKEQCGLCDEALAKIRPLARWTGVSLIVRDVAAMSDAGIAARVPVLMAKQTELHAGPMAWPDAIRVILRARFTRS